MSTNQMHDHDHDHDHDRKRTSPRALVALFYSVEEARQAVGALHKAHFTRTWLGTTSLAQASDGTPALTVESATPGFFSGTQSLVDALVKHGVRGETARALEAGVEPGNAVLTIDPKDREPAQAASIVRDFGGMLPDETVLAEDESYDDALVDSGFEDDPALWREETFYRSGPALR